MKVAIIFQITKYLGETKVLQFFGNMRHNSVATYGFVEVLNLMTDDDLESRNPRF